MYKVKDVNKGENFNSINRVMREIYSELNFEYILLYRVSNKDIFLSLFIYSIFNFIFCSFIKLF
ncbi:hypothetical protein Q7M_1401 (plasmid) [Borrelia crocidurae str. Achema]|uniref:Uncharacterized protein n=1 Tax=Borrelia crocidurae (strain Achema) TaxID=1155096 RepID=I0FDV7_BORCA|nr:hypothetical protein Q7M_1401 [Borrelia crocidurae str. Achema]